MQYEFSPKVSVREISELRKSVGWNGMEECYKDSLLPFYKKFGFNITLSGQLETRHID